MSISENYLNYVLEQLECIGSITAKRMFGGAGLYHNGLFFALIADDILYFKVDDTNRSDYESAGMGPFRPYGEKSYAMQYYEVPIEVIEDTERLYQWANKALAVARCNFSKKAKRHK